MSWPPVGDRPSMAPSLTDQIFGLPSQPSRVVPSNSLTRPAGVAAGALAASSAGGAASGWGAPPDPPPPGDPADPPVPLGAGGGVVAGGWGVGAGGWAGVPGAEAAPPLQAATHASKDRQT